MADRVLRVIDQKVRVSVAGGPIIAALAAQAAFDQVEPLAERAEAAEQAVRDIMDEAGEVQGSGSVTFQAAPVGSVVRSVQSKLRDDLDVRDFDIYPDSEGGSDGTNQTAAMVDLLTDLGTAGFRGFLRIPYGVRFDLETVYDAVPVGVVLYDDSVVNWGQPPGYIARLRVEYSGDLVADDTQKVFASPHHPAITLLNMGKSGSLGAERRWASLIQGVGINANGDPLEGWLMQFGRDQSEEHWNWGLRLQTPYTVAIQNPLHWEPLTGVTAGAMRLGAGLKVYQTAAGGTTGSTQPSGTGTGIDDGGVIWDYVQDRLNIDRSVMDLREDGRLGVYGPEEARISASTGAFGVYLSVDDDGVVRLRDVARGGDILSVTDAFGVRRSIAESDHWLAVTGATPAAPDTGSGKVTNASPTTMTSMSRPSGRTVMTVTLRFEDANTTLQHGGGFQLKGATNVNPPAGGYLVLKVDTSDSGAWREFSRSF